ncbi:NAD(P)H-binding protein [Streptomyces sp. 7N604]|uniref:NAD(P)H-binding protein n=1 Tax=Streptomyces sp. 7N604 TaxID=3457415 RepID=UPI003FD51F5B
MILLTGASGTVGRRTARLLAHEGHAIRLLTRDPARLPEPTARAETVVGDFEEPATLRRALSGVRAALIVTNNPLRPAHDAELITAAARAGVQRLVKLSALGVTDSSADDLITRWQRETEDCVRTSGLEWTLLRPRAFMSNSLGWAPDIRAKGTVSAWPGDAPSACVDPYDIAAVAARALTEPGHASRAYALTGPESLTARQQTAILGTVLGRPLVFREQTREQTRQLLESRYPAPVAQALLEIAERRLLGNSGQVNPTVERLIGRPARSYADWADEHGLYFAPADRHRQDDA